MTLIDDFQPNNRNVCISLICVALFFSQKTMPTVCVEKTPLSDRIAVEAAGPLVEVAVCAFSKSVSETIRLASQPDQPFKTIVHYDGDMRRFLSENVVVFRPPNRRFSLDIIHERPLSEVHLRLVDTTGKATVRRVNIDNYIYLGDKQ